MLKKYPVTIGTAIVVALTYTIELALAGSTTPNAAYTYLMTVIETQKTLIWLLSPLLHSSHIHVTQNLILFLPFAALIEYRTQPTVFLFFIFAVGYIGMFVTVVLTGAIGVGLSAVTFALQAREAAYRIHVLWRSPDLPYRRVLKHGTIFTVSFLLVWIGLAQAIGYLPSAPGTAQTAHVAGVVIGGLWPLFNLDNWLLNGDASVASM